MNNKYFNSVFEDAYQIQQNTNNVSVEKTSYEAHNSEYVEEGKLQIEKETHKKFTRENLQDKPDVPLGKTLKKFNDIKYAVDVGSGTGWAAKYMAARVEKVWAIEPSAAAVAIAKELSQEFSNIEWIVGFGEEVLKKIALPNQPVFFNTMCVLSHLPDEITVNICADINEKAPRGSVISLSECWGNEHHENLWHVRTQNWWSKQFPNWNLTFIPTQIQNVSGRYKGIYGQKI